MIEVDVWVRGTSHAKTHKLPTVAADAAAWTEDDVRSLLTEMLRALDREKNPDSEPPPVFFRGFSWIVSPYEDGVMLHLEMPLGSASAGPFGIDEQRLTAMIDRVMKTSEKAERVH